MSVRLGAVQSRIRQWLSRAKRRSVDEGSAHVDEEPVQNHRRDAASRIALIDDDIVRRPAARGRCVAARTRVVRKRSPDGRRGAGERRQSHRSRARTVPHATRTRAARAQRPQIRRRNRGRDLRTTDAGRDRTMANLLGGSRNEVSRRGKCRDAHHRDPVVRAAVVRVVAQCSFYSCRLSGLPVESIRGAFACPPVRSRSELASIHGRSSYRPPGALAQPSTRRPHTGLTPGAIRDQGRSGAPHPRAGSPRCPRRGRSR